MNLMEYAEKFRARILMAYGDLVEGQVYEHLYWTPPPAPPLSFEELGKQPYAEWKSPMYYFNGTDAPKQYKVYWSDATTTSATTWDTVNTYYNGTITSTTA